MISENNPFEPIESGEVTVKLVSLNNKNPTVAESAITLLMNEWPLTSRGIHNRINRRFTSASFQAVHKAVKKLHEESILEKNDRYYKINLAWLEQIKSFSEKITKDYTENETRLVDLP